MVPFPNHAGSVRFFIDFAFNFRKRFPGWKRGALPLLLSRYSIPDGKERLTNAGNVTFCPSGPESVAALFVTDAFAR